VTPGAFLTLSTRDYFSLARSAPSAIVPQFAPRAASSWLSYDNFNDTLSGFVPRSTTYDEVNVTFYATDLETHAVSTVSMLLSISSNETSGPDVWGHSHGPNVSAQGKAAIIVVFSVIGGAILLCCLLALCRCYCGVREPRDDDESSSQCKGHIPSPSAHHVLFSEKMTRSIGLSQTSATTDGSSEDGSKLPVSALIPSKQAGVDSGPKGRTMKKVRFFQHLLTPSKRVLRDQRSGSQPGKIRRSQISRPTPISNEDMLAQLSIAHTESGSCSGGSETPGCLEEQRVPSGLGVVDSDPSFGWPKAGPTMQGPEPLSLESSAQATPDRSSQVPSESDGSSLTSIPRRRSDFLPPRHRQMVRIFERSHIEVHAYTDILRSV
jgi:axial budding pattern protein 2